MPTEQYANTATTTLNGTITSGAVSGVVSGITGFPTSGQFRILIGSELLLVTAVSGTTWTWTRGVEGTTAAGHTSGAVVTLMLTAASLQAVATNPVGSLSVRGQGMFAAVCFEQSDSNMYLMASNDSVKWDLVRPDAVYKPSGGVRDPSLYYDGTTYWVAYTRQTAPVGSWGIASSPDLVNWTHVVDVDETGIIETDGAVTTAWGPCWFVDPLDNSVHVFLTLGHTTSTMRLYETHPVDPTTMASWSTAVKLTGTALPTDYIDPFVIKSGTTYFVFYKNDAAGNKHIELMSSTSLTSGYTVVGSGTWLSNWTVVSGNGWEGPTVLQIDSNTWRMFVESTDVSDNGLGYYYSDYTGVAGVGWATGASWSALTALIAPITQRHNSVVRFQDFQTARNIMASYMNGNRRPSAHVHGTPSTAHATTTALVFTVVDRDDDNYFSSTKFTVPTTGWYHIDSYTHWSSNGVGQRIIELRINGSTFINGCDDDAVSNGDKRQHCSAIRYMFAGDYVEVAAFQSSTTTLSTIYAAFAISRIS